MGELAAADFDEYFWSVHGHEPYPWQSRLTRRVLDGGGWPDVIDLPTGAGKTAVLDTAVFALAVRPDVSPRRVVFVIDRRIVVDQVYERAQLIRDRIAAAGGGVLGELRRLLGGLTDAGEPLGVAALRGGIPIDGEWARRPDQPSVMVSTVDQFGSRLLFRGYGVSERMRPVHAGLAGNDCLVILDEVHLSAAFAATLRDVSSDGDVPLIRAVNASCLPRRFTVVEMSATPQNRSGNRFQLQDGDLDASPRLNRIANAAKRATLVEVGGTRPPHESVPKKVLEILKSEALRDHETSVGVIVNRVRTARETHAMLQRAGYAAHLVTGRMRPIDRQHALEQITAAVDPDREAPLGERTVVVATQAIEVGADFSFDALISEAAPIDSLTQRLGRLDRRGTLAAQRQEPARCWILGAAPVLNPKRPDPVYGHAVACAWEQLQASAQDNEIDVGPGTAIISRTDPNALAPRSEAPLVLPTHIGAWSQTSPQPVADAPIAEFLHGKERPQEPEVSVVWRWDRSARALELVPPRPAESLSVPMSAIKSWLRGTDETPVSDTASALAQHDPTSKPHARHGPRSARPHLRDVVRWVRRGATPAQPLNSVDDIESGDLIVLDPALGGLRDGTWDPHFLPAATDGTGSQDAPAPVTDLGDEAQLAHGVRPGGGARGVRATLRLDPRLAADMRVEAAPMPSPAEERDASISTREAVDAWLAEVQRLPSSVPGWLATTVERFGREASFDIEVVEPESDSDAAYYVLVERSVDPAILDESDEAPSLTGTMTPLRSHLQGVGARAAASGARLGLSEEVVADLRLAGELHDLGKVDHRFQAQLVGHDPVRIAEADEPLAKSLPRARTRSGGWPPVRHEFTSVALVQSNPAILEESHDPDLVLHLVGTHHGFGRPLPQIRGDDQPMELEAAGQLQGGSFRLRAVEGPHQTDEDRAAVQMSTSTDLAGTSLALDMADRFWRLQGRYGHHGLAWLEAILRLADHQQSAEEARHG